MSVDVVETDDQAVVGAGLGASPRPAPTRRTVASSASSRPSSPSSFGYLVLDRRALDRCLADRRLALLLRHGLGLPEPAVRGAAALRRHAAHDRTRHPRRGAGRHRRGARDGVPGPTPDLQSPRSSSCSPSSPRSSMASGASSSSHLGSSAPCSHGSTTRSTIPVQPAGGRLRLMLGCIVLTVMILPTVITISRDVLWRSRTTSLKAGCRSARRRPRCSTHRASEREDRHHRGRHARRRARARRDDRTRVLLGGIEQAPVPTGTQLDHRDDRDGDRQHLRQHLRQGRLRRPVLPRRRPPRHRWTTNFAARLIVRRSLQRLQVSWPPSPRPHQRRCPAISGGRSSRPPHSASTAARSLTRGSS